MESLGDVDLQLYSWVPTGIGLCLIGLLNALLPRVGVVGRVLLSGIPIGITFGFMSTLDVDRTAYRFPAATFAIALAVVALLQSRLVERVRRPAVAWGLVFAAGLGVTVAAIVRHDRAVEAVVDQQMDEFNVLTYTPERRWIDDVAVATDRGQPIPVAVAKVAHTRAEMDGMERRSGTLGTYGDNTIKLRPADVNSNCHGWVFTGGRYIVGGEAVETILQDNGYEPVRDPEPGDIAVYRDNGSVTHTAVVRYVSADRPVMVESKWGWMGVYLHAADKSCYGTNFTFYHTPRGGDVLKGINSPASPITAAPEPDPDTVD